MVLKDELELRRLRWAGSKALQVGRGAPQRRGVEAGTVSGHGAT